jgi:hypothetical protein
METADASLRLPFFLLASSRRSVERGEEKLEINRADCAPCSIKEQPKRNVLQRLAQRGELDLEEEGHGLYHL